MFVRCWARRWCRSDASAKCWASHAPRNAASGSCLITKRECLAVVVDRKLSSDRVLEQLTHLFTQRGAPDYIRSDNGSEFTATRVRKWLADLSVKTLFIEPGSPWENGYVEAFNGTLRRDLLNREIFDTLLEAQVLVERWRNHFNTVRPHSSLGYRPPAPEARQPWAPGFAPPSTQGCVRGQSTTWGLVSLVGAGQSGDLLVQLARDTEDGGLGGRVDVLELDSLYREPRIVVRPRR